MLETHRLNANTEERYQKKLKRKSKIKQKTCEMTRKNTKKARLKNMQSVQII